MMIGLLFCKKLVLIMCSGLFGLLRGCWVICLLRCRIGCLIRLLFRVYWVVSLLLKFCVILIGLMKKNCGDVCGVWWSGLGVMVLILICWVWCILVIVWMCGFIWLIMVGELLV